MTVTGTGFGNTQGAGSLTLGTSLGAIVSWSNTQIVATVSAVSISGVAQVWQNGVPSNSVNFDVNSATIANVTPTSGPAGTQVTLNGSGFGSAQGSGQVLIGTAQGTVVSWSDTQIVATVAAGATSGYAAVLQGGVWSNYISFTVTGNPHINYITPTSGIAGTVVDIQGSGFGASQGNGSVWIGGTTATVNGWNDREITAVVGTNSITGILKVQQNSIWSNPVSFWVPASSGATPAMTLSPNVMSMLVGDTRQIVAQNPAILRSQGSRGAPAIRPSSPFRPMIRQS